MSLANINESVRMLLIRALSRGVKAQIDEEIQRCERLRATVFFRRYDYFYLAQQGFEILKNSEYNTSANDETFHKREKITYGDYPGVYDIFVVLTEQYPQQPPLIYAKTNATHSEHLLTGFNGLVCIEGRGSRYDGEGPNSYWKSSMNVCGALKLAYHVLTNELTKKFKKKVKSNITGTIFEELSKVTTVKDFIKTYKRDNVRGFEYVDDTYTWEELASELKTVDYNTKKSFITIYNKFKAGIKSLRIVVEDEGDEG